MFRGRQKRGETHFCSTAALSQGCTFKSPKELLKTLMLRSNSRQIYQNLWEWDLDIWIFWDSQVMSTCSHHLSLSILSLSYLKQSVWPNFLGGKAGDKGEKNQVPEQILSTQGRTRDRWGLLPSSTSHTLVPSTRHRAKKCELFDTFPKPVSFYYQPGHEHWPIIQQSVRADYPWR